MSEKYSTVEQYKCRLAESCWYRDRMENALERAANHETLARDARGDFDDERFKTDTDQ